MNGSGQAVAGVVANLDGISLILELLNSNDRSKDLLLGDLHVGSDIGEDGRLDEVALGTMTFTTQSDSSTLLLAVVDIFHDTVELELRDLRALEGTLLEGVSELVLSRTLLEASDELVVDTLLNQQTGTCAAALAVVEEDTEVGPRDGVVNVSIVKDNVGRLATQLKGDLLQVTLGSGLQDGTANEGRASEGNLVNVHVGGDGSTSSATETRDDVDDAGREASLNDQLGGIQTRQRSLLRSLDDDGVAGSDGGTDLPSPHEDGEVPGNNLATDTNRLVAGVRQGLSVGVNGLTVNLVSPATVVAQAARGVGNVDLGHGHGLAVVQGLDGSQGLDITLEQVSQLGEHTATV